MNVFRAWPVDRGELALPTDQADYDRFAEFGRGDRLADGWVPVEMTLVRFDEGHRRAAVDIPWFLSESLILTPRAVDLIGSDLTRWGELLPLVCGDVPLVAFNALHVLDALDETASELIHLPSGRILRAERLELLADVIADVDLFRLPQFPTASSFFSQRLVDRIVRSGVTGLRFELVWSNAAPV